MRNDFFGELQALLMMNDISLPELNKELEANLEKALNITGSTSMTNISQFTGGKAITMENVDRDLSRLYHDETDFTLTKLLPEEKLGSLVDRFTTKTGTGSETDGTNSYGTSTTELGFPAAFDAEFVHLLEQAKFVRAIKQMSHVIENVNDSIINVEADLNADGATIVAENRELQNIYGDDDVIPSQYNGLLKQAEDINDPDGDLRAKYNVRENMIIDLRGAALTQGDLLDSLLVLDENYSQGSHAIMSKSLRSYLDETELADSVRAVRRIGDKIGSGGTLAGQPVMGLDATNARGNILKFVGNRYMPSGDDAGSKCPTSYAGTAPTAPSSVAAAAASDSDSLFAAADEGTYWYKVVAVHRDGHATAVAISGAVDVDAGEKVTLTITHGSGGTAPSGFKIFRSEKGAADSSDCRYIGQCAIATGATTTYVDLNENIPGTGKVIVLDLPSEKKDRGIAQRKLLPFFKIELPFGYNSVFGRSFAFGYYGYLRIKKPCLAVIKNIGVPGHGF